MKSLLSLVLLFAVALAKELPKQDAAPDTPSQYVLDENRLPENMVVVEGTEVTISCAAQDSSTSYSIEWVEYAYNPNGGPISSNEFIGQPPEAARYSIVHTDELLYSLRISPVVMGDGGTYLCRDANANPALKRQHSMELTVVAASSNCTTTIHDTGVVLDQSYQTNDCVLSYKGGLVPNMTWSGPLPFGQLYISGTSSVWAGMQFNVTRDMDTRAHTCTTFFTGYFLPVDGNRADNVPSYSHIFQSRQMFVYWGPTSMQATPIKTKYRWGMF